MDGRLEQFSRPAGREVKARRVAPAATGYQDDLYAMPGLPDGLVQQVEQKFMQEVDRQAAEVLTAVEAGTIVWTHETRSAWTRFIQSLQLRTPADVEGIKARTLAEWGVSIPKIQETYESMRRLGDPATFEEFIDSKDPLLVERAALRILTVLIDAPEMGRFINNMHWEVLDLESSALTLLTSDQAVEQPWALREARSFLSVPMGPKRLFVAARRRETIAAIAQAGPTKIVELRNVRTVCCAREFVWAADRSLAPFIAEHISTVRMPTLGERLAQHDDERPSD